MLAVTGFTSLTEDKSFPPKISFQVRGRLFFLDKPKVMGILNLTPDSFFEGSRIKAEEKSFLLTVEKMISDGADFLDLGGYSTRPGAEDISSEVEKRRVIPAITYIKKAFPEILVSIDTFRSDVAKAAVDSGADLINDISSGSIDPFMLETVSNLGVPYIAMHMRGTPQTMEVQTDYNNLVPDILHYFAEKLDEFRKLGIKDVIIDPGFGFAKTTDQNFDILRNLESFKMLGLPLVVGISRKSMIYKTLECQPAEALNGTTALNMFALSQGANILRVHDIKEAKETITLFEKLYP